MADKELTKKTQADVTRREQPQERPVFVPAADIWETPDAITLKLDMPGVGPEDVEVNVQRGTLRIHGKVNADAPETVLYAEQRVGDFEREFTLSEDLDTDNVAAAMNAGVLTLTIGKADKVKPRKIAVKAE
ncbi:MAG TPA: Hsp20/alpha crystallin family protein [Phycisphaerales bacterium]|nr:Hsp20/alpha crystallin family protein [Phycisphaerales bacterium]